MSATYEQYKRRYERGQEWHRKGLFWLAAQLVFMVLVLTTPTYLAEKDSQTYLVLVIANFAFLAVQFACIARMAFCYRRAKKIWRSSP